MVRCTPGFGDVLANVTATIPVPSAPTTPTIRFTKDHLTDLAIRHHNSPIRVTFRHERQEPKGGITRIARVSTSVIGHES